jgi:hypothetical protein
LPRVIRISAPLIVALLLVAVAAVGSAPAADADPSAESSALRRCNISGQERTFGTTYVTSLRVRGTSCRNAKRVVRAFHRCRKRSGGADGRCRRRVLRYRCTEGTRLKSPTQYDARVNCRRGRALVSHRYTQNT